MMLVHQSPEVGLVGKVAFMDMEQPPLEFDDGARMGERLTQIDLDARFIVKAGAE
jgi:hypothetical protein